MAELVLPPRTEHGFLLLPEGSVRWGQRVNTSIEGRRSSHHLYWTSRAYGEPGSVSRLFRDHPVNRTTLPRVAHTAWHDKYDPAVVAEPERIRPSEVSMGNYLDDLVYFDALRKAIGRIRSIDSDIRQGTYAEPLDVGLERRATFVDEVLLLSKTALRTELVPRELIEYAMFNTMARFTEEPPQEARVA